MCNISQRTVRRVYRLQVKCAQSHTRHTTTPENGHAVHGSRVIVRVTLLWDKGCAWHGVREHHVQARQHMHQLHTNVHCCATGVHTAGVD
jgi:hypothetical protein